MHESIKSCLPSDKALLCTANISSSQKLCGARANLEYVLSGIYFIEESSFTYIIVSVTLTLVIAEP